MISHHAIKQCKLTVQKCGYLLRGHFNQIPTTYLLCKYESNCRRSNRGIMTNEILLVGSSEFWSIILLIDYCDLFVFVRVTMLRVHIIKTLNYLLTKCKIVGPLLRKWKHNLEFWIRNTKKEITLRKLTVLIMKMLWNLVLSIDFLIYQNAPTPNFMGYLHESRLAHDLHWLLWLLTLAFKLFVNSNRL